MNTFTPDLTAFSTLNWDLFNFKLALGAFAVLLFPVLFMTTSLFLGTSALPLVSHRLRFGVLSCRSITFSFIFCKSFSINGLMWSNVFGSSLRRRFRSPAKPLFAFTASLTFKHAKKAASLSGGQFDNIINTFCVGSLTVALPSLTKRLWRLISFRRKFCTICCLTTIRKRISPNWSRPSIVLQDLYEVLRSTTPFEFNFSTLAEHNSSLASIALHQCPRHVVQNPKCFQMSTCINWTNQNARTIVL